MKIGFLGNANNYPFMLARAIKRLGHEVRFVLMFDSSWRLDRPENRYVDTAPPYPDWIYDAGHVDLWNASRCSTQQPRVIEQLQDCDAVVLNQYGLCLADRIGKPAIAILTGTDLLTLADRSYADDAIAADGTVNHPSKLAQTIIRNFYSQRVEAQRFAIASAIMVNYMPRGVTPGGDKTLDELGVTGPRRTCFFMTDTHALEQVPLPHNDPVRVFCATRFTWDRTAVPRYTDLDYKGSDVMIRGLGRFVKGGVPLEIHLVKKGEHVAQAMALAESEGLKDFVTWHDEMSQMEVWNHFRKADIILEQFGSSAVGIAGTDAMAMGRPVIAHGRPEEMTAAFGSPLPVCQAATEQEICDQLTRLVPNRDERVRVATAARRQMERHFSAQAAAVVVLKRLKRFLRFWSNRKAKLAYRRQLEQFRRQSHTWQCQQEVLLEQLRAQQLLAWRQERQPQAVSDTPLS